ncbi:15674_t:CDS:2 [Acaulospora morrowiae]|uniref:15674_t:CDS:1 n=1 Tax=Acaulospora morrowiae TaxID=94023 RepID=A0A9N9GQX3_9GLOM|nr:15674_t:CDS:2 [Acaulospora morrowiae]
MRKGSVTSSGSSQSYTAYRSSNDTLVEEGRNSTRITSSRQIYKNTLSSSTIVEEYDESSLTSPSEEKQKSVFIDNPSTRSTRFNSVGDDDDQPPIYTDRKKSIYKPVQKPPLNTIQTSFFHIYRFATLFDYFLMALGIFFSILAGLAIPFMTLITGDIFNVFTDKQTGKVTAQAFQERVNFLVMEFMLLGLGDFIVIFAMVTFWNWTGERQARRMREIYFRSLLRMHISYFEQSDITSGGLLTSVNKDSEDVQNAISENMGHIIQYTVTAFSCLILAFMKNVILTLVILASMPLIFLALAFTSRLAGPLLSKEREVFIKAGNTLENALTAIKTIKAFNGEEKEEKKHFDNLNEANTASSGLARTYALRTGLIQFFLLSLFFQGFWYGSVLVANKQLAPGDVLSIFYASLLGVSVLKGILPKLIILSKAKEAIKSINILLEKVALLDLEALRGFKLSEIKGNIEFSEVSFSYPTRPDVAVMKNINLLIPAEKTTVFVGQSGSGKSTIAQLVQRLYEPDNGLITLDGRELRILNISWLRQQIGVVSQEPVLFDDTIFQNVAYGRPDYWNVTLDQVISACKTACIHDFIQELPEGYNTRLGDKAKKLSGGQRQRLSIARALIKDPAILILDEASSALDMESDALVQQALQNSRVGRTTIVITHNLSHINESDTIYVLFEGEIVESGTTAQLLENPEGHFSKLAEESRQKRSPKRKTYELDMINMRLKRSETYYSTYSVVDSIPPSPSLRNRSSQFGWSPSAYTEHFDTKAIDVLNTSALAAVSKRRMSLFDILSYYEDETAEDGVLIDVLVTTPDDASTKEGRRRTSILKLILETMQNRVTYSFGVISSVINGLVMPLFSFVLASLLNTYAIPERDELLKESRKYAIFVILIAVVNGISAYYKYFLLERASEQWAVRLRHLGFRTVLRQPPSWFDKSENAIGRLTTVLITDTNTTKNLIGHFVGNITFGSVSLLGGIIWALAVGWQLTLVGFGLVPILLIASELQGYVLQKYEKKQKLASEEMSNLFYQTISSIRTVFSLAIESAMEEKFQSALKVPYMIGIRKAFFGGFTTGLLDAFQYFSKAITFWYGAHLVSQGIYDLQKMLIVWTLVIFCTTSASQMLATIPYYAKSKQAAKSIAKILNLPIEDTTSGDTIDDVQGVVELRDVHFSYPERPDIKVLNGLNLTLQPNQSIALVGKSGNGKSTVAALLQRFYEPSSGRILFDHIPLKDLQLHWLREQIGIVSQEPILFDASVSENIAYGKPDATQEEIEVAARQVNMHDFIQSLPDGYNTKLGSSGSQLSGGQKQRISIARVLLRNPKILILDEATSALDVTNEQIVNETLVKVQKGRTTLVITHRLNNVKNMDRIALVEDGQITEVGNHRELMSKKGGYFNLVTSGNL